MSAEPLGEFIDTNVLVYAFDASAGDKQVTARALLKRMVDAETGCLSVQILQEFFVVVRSSKIPQPLSIDEAADRVWEFAMTWQVFEPTAMDVLAAIELSKQAQLKFWDAMILHAAAESGCGVLWTEDLNDGQIVRGVQIRNPFAAR
jgi:predicted nucleic acid-binding protein